MTYNCAYRKGIEILRNAGIEAPANDAGVLLCLAAKCDRTFIYAHGDRMLEEGVRQHYQEMLRKRAHGYPLQHITGVQEFMSLIFEVSPDVLIPRQDTELLVEAVIDTCGSGRTEILDMCTGSGCIAVSLAWHLTGCFVVAADIMPEAIRIAAKNASKNGVSERICFIQSDLFAEIPTKKFDVIVSNPPYIRTRDIDGLRREVKGFEPAAALDGGIDGLAFYREIIRNSPAYLKNSGMLAFETGYDQAGEVAAMLTSDGRYQDIIILKDLAGIDRVVTARHVY